MTKDDFSLSIVGEDTVSKILLGISSDKATGLDGLPARFLRDGAVHVIGPLTHIINLTIYHGEIPKDLKTARVVPLHKKKSKTEVGNYRPVSVLTVVSKVLERVIYNQVQDYLQQKELLYDYQSGFRPSFSTDTCLIHLTDHIKNQIDKGNYTGMVLLDLQKAFDTVDHDILLMKLHSMGLSDTAVRWFKSYLTGRSQIVGVNGVNSHPKDIVCGVPQGSILGPLLFLIYVNDMERAVSCKLLLYADDSALLISGKSVQDIELKLSMELTNVNDWLVDNKLSLHLGKTESILFGSRIKIKRTANLNISCRGTKIASKQSVGYLGSNLDQTLSGEENCKKIVQISNSRLKFLYRQAKFLNLATRRTLVSALVQCHFDYAASSWYHSLSKMSKSKLQVCQNKLIRFVFDLGPRSHLGVADFKRIGWLPVEQRVWQTSLSHVHKVLHGHTAPYLHQDLTRVADIHSYNTRNSQQGLVVPRSGSYGQKTFYFNAIKQWNKLPVCIQSIPTFSQFKLATKHHLFAFLQNQENASSVFY